MRKSSDEKMHFRAKIKKVPALSHLLRWGYGWVMLPARMRIVLDDVKELKTRVAADGERRAPVPENPLFDGASWARFYAKEEVSEAFIDLNVRNHRCFVDMVRDLARESAGANRLPRIVEFGVGTASMTIWFSRQPFEVFGLDNDPIIIAKARLTQQKRGGGARFICVDGFDMDALFKERCFDAVFSQGTMEHFDDDMIVLLIRKQLKVARNVVFSVPSIHYPRKDRGDERLLSLEHWKTLLESAGLPPKRITYYWDDQHIAVAVSASNARELR